jgi:hypothetical protein
VWKNNHKEYIVVFLCVEILLKNHAVTLSCADVDDYNGFLLTCK